VIALGAGPLIWLLHGRTFGPADTDLARPRAAPATAGTPRTNDATVASDLAPPVPSAPADLVVPASASAAPPSVVIDVASPAKLRQAAQHNAWLQAALAAPLGQGFVGPWAGFWGSRGEDLAGAFKGQVLDVIFDQLLDAPARMIWFGGPESTSTPAVLVPHPRASARAAFDTLTHAAGRGVQTATRCPGDPLSADGGLGGTRKIEIDRWVVANEALYGSMGDGALALARSPQAVLQALCTQLGPQSLPRGVDVDVTLATAGLGHDARLLTHLLGLGPAPHLSFALQGDRLVPLGIGSAIAQPGRIGVAALSSDLLRTVPADAPVLLTAQLALPAALDPASLSAAFTGKAKGDTALRQVALVWIPHGDRSPSELALIWSRVSDGPALDAAFSGGLNAVHEASICNQLVYASTPALLEALRRTCQGKKPSLANAAGPVVAGLRAEASVGLTVQLGSLLSGITLDAWSAEAKRKDPKQPKPSPAELETALDQLEALPTLGLTGTAHGAALVGGGFHS